MMFESGGLERVALGAGRSTYEMRETRDGLDLVLADGATMKRLAAIPVRRGDQADRMGAEVDLHLVAQIDDLMRRTGGPRPPGADGLLFEAPAERDGDRIAYGASAAYALLRDGPRAELYALRRESGDAGFRARWLGEDLRAFPDARSPEIDRAAETRLAGLAAQAEAEAQRGARISSRGGLRDAPSIPYLPRAADPIAPVQALAAVREALAAGAEGGRAEPRLAAGLAAAREAVDRAAASRLDDRLLTDLTGAVRPVLVDLSATLERHRDEGVGRAAGRGMLLADRAIDAIDSAARARAPLTAARAPQVRRAGDDARG